MKVYRRAKGGTVMLMLMLSIMFVSSSLYALSLDDATTAIDAVIRVFWDPDINYFYCNSDHFIHLEHACGPYNGLYADFWWEAQMWQFIMDAYDLTKNTKYYSMIDKIYDGFIKMYPTWHSVYNDDLGWWALACTHAYNITQNSKYIERAKIIFDKIYTYYDSQFGGGIWWKQTQKDQKNMVTNAVAAMVGVRLSTIYGSGYLKKAKKIYNWINKALVINFGDERYICDHINSEGSLVNWQLSYNYGVYIGINVELYEKTEKKEYFDNALAAAKWVSDSISLVNEGKDDGGGFKGILARHMAHFNQLLMKKGMPTFRSYLRKYAAIAWAHRRRSDNLIGSNLQKIPTDSDYIQCLSAEAGAEIIISSFF